MGTVIATPQATWVRRRADILERAWNICRAKAEAEASHDWLLLNGRAAAIGEPRGCRLDQDARMVWLSMRRAARPFSAAELEAHWQPTFSAQDITGALASLLRGGYVRHMPRSGRYEITADCPALPGYEAEPINH